MADPVTGLTAADRKALAASWDVIKSNLEGNGTELLVLLFEFDKSTMNYFDFAKGKEPAACRGDPKVAKHGTVVLNSLGQYVQNCADSAAVVSQAKKLASTHIPRNVKSAQFEIVRKMFPNFLKKALGGKNSPDVEKAWDTLINAHITVVKGEEK